MSTNAQSAALFRALDSLEKVKTACGDGVLETLFLLPPEFGGKEVAENIVYVPRGIADSKKQIDATVTHLFRAGSVNKYAARPEYAGNSFVPVRIVIKAWHTDPAKAATFNPVIEVWSENPH
jgi:hypothetical protein